MACPRLLGISSPQSPRFKPLLLSERGSANSKCRPKPSRSLLCHPQLVFLAGSIPHQSLAMVIIARVASRLQPPLVIILVWTSIQFSSLFERWLAQHHRNQSLNHLICWGCWYQLHKLMQGPLLLTLILIQETKPHHLTATKFYWSLRGPPWLRWTQFFS